MDEGGIDTACRDLGNGTNNGIVHNDRIAFGVTGASGVAVHAGIEYLLGIVLCDRAGNDGGARSLTV